jgi:hypothetical protein
MKTAKTAIVVSLLMILAALAGRILALRSKRNFHRIERRLREAESSYASAQLGRIGWPQ